MLIRDLMTPNPITVQADTPVEEIAKLLLVHRINGVPVVDTSGHLLGMVTAADLIYRGPTNGSNPGNPSGRKISGFLSLARRQLSVVKRRAERQPR